MEQNTVPAFPGPTDLLAESWKAYSLKWKYFVKLILFSFLITAIPLLIFVLISLPFVANGYQVFSHPFNPETFIGWFLGNALPWVVFLFIFVLFEIFLGAWSQVALLVAVISDEVLSIKETYKRAWQKFASYFWTTLLVGLTICTGYILFLIPGIILSIFLSMAGYVVLVDNVSGFNALARSKAYIYGHGWQVLSRIAIVVLISIVYELLASYLTKISSNLSLLTSIVSIFVINPILIIYSFLIFKHLKAVNGEAVEGSTVLYKIFALLPILFLALGVYFGWQSFTSREFMDTIQKEWNKNTLPIYSAGTKPLVN